MIGETLASTASAQGPAFLAFQDLPDSPENQVAQDFLEGKEIKERLDLGDPQG